MTSSPASTAPRARSKRWLEPLVRWAGDAIPARSWEAYGFAGLCVAVATLLRTALAASDANYLPVYAGYYVAILVATLLAGGRAGALSIVLGGLAGYFLFPPPDFSAYGIDMARGGSLAMYLGYGALIAGIAAAYRHAVADLVAERAMRQLIADEMRHRMRNMGALIQAAIRNSLGPDSENARSLMKRIDALLLTNEEGARGEAKRLSDIIAAETAFYPAVQFKIHGPDAWLSPPATQVAALIFHELAVNAAKYGALAHTSGRVAISWKAVSERIEVRWIETSPGARHVALNNAGFGTRLIGQVLAHVGGTVSYDFAESGLTCTFTLPQTAEVEGAQQGASRPASPNKAEAAA